MRTKYSEKKRELENAFSFGQNKKGENFDSPKKKHKPNQYANRPIDKLAEISLNRDHSANRIAYQR
jgi:hypothetical protein